MAELPGSSQGLIFLLAHHPSPTGEVLIVIQIQIKGEHLTPNREVLAVFDPHKGHHLCH